MEAVDLSYPFRGRWLVLNSPANRVPSHGTAAYRSSQAIDFVPVGPTGRSAHMGWRSWLAPEDPARFPGFGAPSLAPLTGEVVAADDTLPDHPAHRGLPSVTYMLTQQRRAAQGWSGLAGNHVFVRATSGAAVALCHLRQGSLLVRPGDQVSVGHPGTNRSRASL